MLFTLLFISFQNCSERSIVMPSEELVRANSTPIPGGPTVVISPKFIPTITTQPQSALSDLGKSVSFMVAATSTIDGLSYQWYKKSTDQSADIALPNQTTSTLNFTDLKDTDLGTYYVIATNPDGEARSIDVTLAVNANLPPEGVFALSADKQSIEGCLYDPNNHADIVKFNIYANGDEGTGTLLTATALNADSSEAALTSACAATGGHGFRAPLSVIPASERTASLNANVYLRAIDPRSGTSQKIKTAAMTDFLPVIFDNPTVQIYQHFVFSGGRIAYYLNSSAGAAVNLGLTYTNAGPAFKVYTIQEPGMRGLYNCQRTGMSQDIFVSPAANCVEGGVAHTPLGLLGYLYPSATNQRSANVETKRCLHPIYNTHLSGTPSSCTTAGFTTQEFTHGYATP